MVLLLASHLEDVTTHCHTAACSLQQRTLLYRQISMAKMMLFACLRKSGCYLDSPRRHGMHDFVRWVGTMRSDGDEDLPGQWDNVFAIFQESLGTANGGHLGPMLDLVAELRAAPPASRLFPWTSLQRLVVSRLSPTVFPQPHVWATLHWATGRFEVGYSQGQPEVTEVHDCDPLDAGSLFQRLTVKLSSTEGLGAKAKVLGSPPSRSDGLRGKVEDAERVTAPDGNKDRGS